MSKILNLSKYDVYVSRGTPFEAFFERASHPLSVRMNHEKSNSNIKTYRVTQHFLDEAVSRLTQAANEGYTYVILNDATVYELRLNLGDSYLQSLGITLATFRCYTLANGVVDALYLADCLSDFQWHN